MKVVAFGEIMLRLMVPENKLLNQSDELQSLYCGTGLNILAQLTKWGYNTEMITTLPNNNIGLAAAAQIRKVGVCDNFINYKNDSIGIYFLETGFGQRPSVVTYMNRLGSSFCLSSASDYNFDEILKDVDAIHICGIVMALSESVREAAIKLAKEAHERDIKVCFDFNYRPSLWKGYSYEESKKQYERILPYCDIVFAGLQDGNYILGIEGEIIEDVLKKMAIKYDIQAIACTSRITKDDKSYYSGILVNKGIVSKSKEYPLYVMDRIGAGDGFSSGIIFGILENKSDEYIVEYATCSGVLAHTTYGDIPANSDIDIQLLMNGSNKDLIR